MGLPLAKPMKGSFQQGQVTAVLRGFWRQLEEQARNDPFKIPRVGTVFDIQPSVSSQEAVAVVVDLEPVVGFKVSDKIIKKGGYHNCDEFISHLVPQLKELHDAQ